MINDPQTPYVLAGKGVDPQGTLVARRGDLRLYRIHGPLRLRSYVTGVYPDGWTGKDATYSRFATGPRRPGTLTIIASREGWKGNSLAGVVSIAIGTLRPRRSRRSRTRARTSRAGRCLDTNPTIGRQLAFRQITVGSGELKRVKRPRDAAVPGRARGLSDLRARGLRRLRQPPARRPDAVRVLAQGMSPGAGPRPGRRDHGCSLPRRPRRAARQARASR